MGEEYLDNISRNHLTVDSSVKDDFPHKSNHGKLKKTLKNHVTKQHAVKMLSLPEFRLEPFDEQVPAENELSVSDAHTNDDNNGGFTVIPLSNSENNLKGLINPVFENNSADPKARHCVFDDQTSICNSQSCLKLPNSGNIENGQLSSGRPRERRLSQSMVDLVQHAAVIEQYRRRSTLPDVRFQYAEFVERITCHGLLDWYQSKSRPSFLFWGFMFSAATAILIYSVYECLNEFYVNPIQTSINVSPVDSIPFPDVYICPSNFINKTAYYRLPPNVTSRISIFQAVAENSNGLIGLKSVISDHLASAPFPESAAEEIPKLTRQQYEILDASLDPKMFIPECKLPGGVDCRKYILRRMDRDRGVCYLIKLGGLQQRISNKGLSIVVDLLLELSPPDSPPLADGIRIGLYSKFDPIKSDTMLIAAGSYNQLSLSKTSEHLVSVSRFSETPQLCNEAGKVEFKVLKTDYSRDACLFDCIQHIYFETRDCLLPIDVAFIQPSYLNITNWCNKADLLSKMNQTAYKKCTKTCHPACEDETIAATLSSQRLPAFYYKNNKKLIALSKKNIQSNNLKDISRWENNVIVLDIAFKRLEVISLTQSKAMTVNTLLSNLGGAFGLWLGASLFTILQSAVFLFKLCYTIVSEKLTGGDKT